MGSFTYFDFNYVLKWLLEFVFLSVSRFSFLLVIDGLGI